MAGPRPKLRRPVNRREVLGLVHECALAFLPRDQQKHVSSLICGSQQVGLGARGFIPLICATQRLDILSLNLGGPKWKANLSDPWYVSSKYYFSAHLAKNTNTHTENSEHMPWVSFLQPKDFEDKSPEKTASHGRI